MGATLDGDKVTLRNTRGGDLASCHGDALVCRRTVAPPFEVNRRPRSCNVRPALSNTPTRRCLLPQRSV
eukprot:scaffold339_cov298-Pavlova_lutheri.AAC.2